METDLKKIKHFGERRRRENFAFRAFLKNLDISTKKLDTLVCTIFHEVSSQIDCKKCANCCKQMKIILTNQDIRRLADGLDLQLKSFKNQYTSLSEDKSEIYFSKIPCPLLKDNLCSKYKFRPTDCRSFPHLEKRIFVSRLWDVVDNYSICPIVFNVYEILKNNLCPYKEYDIYNEYEMY